MKRRKGVTSHCPISKNLGPFCSAPQALQVKGCAPKTLKNRHTLLYICALICLHQDQLIIFLFITEINILNSNVEFLQTEAATLTCILSNILKTTIITWKNGETGVTATGGKYTINAPPYNSAAKTVTSEMEIAAAQLAALAAVQAFACSADVGTTDVTITSTAVSLQIFSEWIMDIKYLYIASLG